MTVKQWKIAYLALADIVRVNWLEPLSEVS
jgi:hypothetical protein